MTLIQSNPATERLNVSSKNFECLLECKSPRKEDVTTQIALDCLAEIKNAQLGWGYSIKKFFATMFTYTSVLTAPFIAMIGLLWLNASRIRTIDLQTLAIGGSVFGGILAADMAIGKIFGVRPITMSVIAAYDAYRYGAKTLSKSVEKSYTDHEEMMKLLIQENRKVMIDELKKTYLGIAKVLDRHTPSEIKLLEDQLPSIEKALKGMGLNRSEVTQILGPIKETMKLLPYQKNTLSAVKYQLLRKSAASAA